MVELVSALNLAGDGLLVVTKLVRDRPLGDYKLIRSTIGSPVRFFREFYGANVTKCVHVEADFPGPDPVEETEWLERIAAEFRLPSAIVAYCDLERADASEQLDRHLSASTRVRGVRILAHPDDPDAAWFRRGYAALGERGLSYELNALPEKLHSGREVAAANPKVQVVVGHAGFPVQRDEPYLAVWRREMTALGEVENVACKISGFGMSTTTGASSRFGPWCSTASTRLAPP